MAGAHSACPAVAARANGGPPELLTMMSKRPKRSIVAATKSVMVLGLSRLPGNSMISTLVSRRISSAACFRSASVRLQMVSFTPSWARTSAQALPRPLLAPPIIATLPSSSTSIAGGVSPSLNTASLSGVRHRIGQEAI